VTHENVILDGDSLANKSMTGNFAMFPNLRILLDFHKTANFRVIANLTTIEVYEFMNFDIFSELYVGGNGLEIHGIFPSGS
jgi:hypothetical protein